MIPFWRIFLCSFGIHHWEGIMARNIERLECRWCPSKKYNIRGVK